VKGIESLLDFLCFRTFISQQALIVFHEGKPLAACAPQRSRDFHGVARVDLMASTPEDIGRWFATAKTLLFLRLATELATELAGRSPADIDIQLRAARDHLDKQPAFALDCATAALHRMAEGQFYELKAGDVWQARGQALRAAEVVGRLEPGHALIAGLIASDATDPFVRTHLSRPFGVPIDR
jgi:hypothetical protein